ncbi:YeeE/YedE family protein [Pelagibacterium limicola]|uniref:YeeE/YedE family protein n=1 Tax=Pelagibacterium limicola TaxID=2791022 RepID=UPI0018AFD270|nr:YeeE/YedE family protein [Pelagibacterium limicola]
MTEFTPVPALLGGALIGVSAVLLMAFHGRIAGMTGILSGLVPPFSGDWGWRAAFIGGAVFAPVLLGAVAGDMVAFQSEVPALWLVLGGLIVGAGVYYGSGCTSGHGVCGIARLSPRSIVATFVFMTSTAATVYLIRHVLGGF